MNFYFFDKMARYTLEFLSRFVVCDIICLNTFKQLFSFFQSISSIQFNKVSSHFHCIQQLSFCLLAFKNFNFSLQRNLSSVLFNFLCSNVNIHRFFWFKIDFFKICFFKFLTKPRRFKLKFTEALHFLYLLQIHF